MRAFVPPPQSLQSPPAPRSTAMLFACPLSFSIAVVAGLLAGVLDDAEGEVAPAERTIKLQRGDRVLFFGDSLTEQGTGPEGYVSLVRHAFTESHPDLEIEVDSV